MSRLLLSLLMLALAATGSGAVAAPKREVGEKAADSADKIICKRFIETGSLVRGYRTCKSKADWQRERDAIRTPGISAGCGNVAQTGRCAI